MDPERRFRRADILGHAVAVFFGCVMVTAIVLHLGSFSGSSKTTQIPGLDGARLEFISWRGRLMFGVFEDRPPPRYWWSRPRSTTGLWELEADDSRYVVADAWGWGLAVPYLLIVAASAVPIAWWMFIFQERKERRRRVKLGLCLNCGYDLRHAGGMCPECGEACFARDAVAAGS